MASIGKLAAGVAHEINNPIDAVRKEADLAYIKEDVFTLLNESKEGMLRVKKSCKISRIFQQKPEKTRESLAHLRLGDGTQLEAAVVVEEPGFRYFHVAITQQMRCGFGERRGIFYTG